MLRAPTSASTRATLKRRSPPDAPRQGVFWHIRRRHIGNSLLLIILEQQLWPPHPAGGATPAAENPLFASLVVVCVCVCNVQINRHTDGDDERRRE